MEELKQRVDALEKKIAELERQLAVQLFTPEDSDGIRGSHESNSTVPQTTSRE